MRKPIIFLSHTTRDLRDHSLAHRLADCLRDCGADVWIAPDSIPTGSDWNSEIVAGIITKCTHFLVILSAASAQSHWVQKEIGLSEERCRTDDTFRILPLYVGNLGDFVGCDFLSRFQKVPYHDDLEAQSIELRECLGLQLVGIDVSVESVNTQRGITIRSRRRSFRVGDEVRIQVRATSDCYLNIVSVDTAGVASVILPNDYQSKCKLKSGEWHVFPPVEIDYALPLNGPAGVERIIAVGGTAELSLSPLEAQAVFDSLAGGNQVIADRLEAELRKKIVGIGCQEFEIAE